MNHRGIGWARLLLLALAGTWTTWGEESAPSAPAPASQENPKPPSAVPS